MEIKYLKLLRDNPIEYPNDPDPKFRFPNRGISIAEIERLESLYNEGRAFPQAFRELLYLAGDFCYIFDYGSTDTMEN